MSIRWVFPQKNVSGVKLKATATAGPVARPAAGGVRRAGAAAARRPEAADWGAMWLLATMNAGLPVHDPPLSVRDEAIFLLHTAAEIEHALLVQYLYAAFSLKTPQDDLSHGMELERWYEMLTTIAKEEMGHLICLPDMPYARSKGVRFDAHHLSLRGLPCV